MKQLIVLSALTLTLVSGTVFAKESLGDSSRYKTLASHNISVSPERIFRRTTSISQISMIVKDTVAETQSTFHDSLKVDLSAQIEAIMSRSLQASLR